MKAKQTSDSPTALARHYKGVVAEQSAEIERLTAALATAEAARDAAVKVIGDAFNQLGWARADAPESERIIGVYDSLKAYIQRTAAPAVDAAPVENPVSDLPTHDDVSFAQRLQYARNGFNNAGSHIALVEDNRAACALEQYGYAIHNIIEALKHMHKGETQS